MFIVYLVHQVYCLHWGTTAEKGLYHYSQEHLVVCSLATAKGVHTMQWGETVKYIYLIKDQEHMSCQRWLSVLL